MGRQAHLLSCGARFYDLQRESITCPACGAAFDVTAQSKPRARATPVAVKAWRRLRRWPRSRSRRSAVEDDVELDADWKTMRRSSRPKPPTRKPRRRTASAIEDVSELGDDDMADVIDTELDEEETDR